MDVDGFDCITLGELIAYLEKFPADARFVVGFGTPHSYRGYYNELAFERQNDVAVRDMLADARGAVGATYQGYKGGRYTMTADAPVWVAAYGCSGVPMRLAPIEPPEVFVLPDPPA
jgi:hypothetical protein